MKITVTVSKKQLKSLQQELKGEGYTVKNPLKLVQILIQDDVLRQLSWHVMEHVLDAGGNNLIGDVLNAKQAKACGATCDIDEGSTVIEDDE